MLIYYIMLAGVVVLGIPLCSSKCEKWGRIVYCVIGAVAFFAVASMRFEVGYDYNLYAGTYFNMKYVELEDIMTNRMEKGFLIPYYVFDLVFENYQTAFVITSAVIYPVIFALIYKYSSKPWISAAAMLCFGVFFNSLCFLRQFIAAIIVAYAIKYVSGKNPFRFFVLVLAASAFHWSSLIMLVLYFFLKIKPSWIYTGIVAAGTVLFCIFSKTMMYWFIDKFYMYRFYDPTTNVEASVGLPPTYTIMFGVMFAVCFAFRKQLAEKNPNNLIYINCLMYSVVFEAMGLRHAVLSRFTILVYLPAVLYLLPDTVQVVGEFITEKIRNEKAVIGAKVGSAFAGSVFAVVFFTLLMLNNYNGVVPYTTVFNRPYEIFTETVITDDSEDNGWDESENEDDGWEDEEWDENEDDSDFDINQEILDRLS